MIKKTVLVTGAGGFIGSVVCNLLENKFNVIGVDNNPTRNASKIIKVDLTDRLQVNKLFKKYKPDVVLHLATHGVYQYQQKDFEKIVLGNYIMALNLLEASKEFGVRKFVNTGSVFEYGSRPGKVKETDVALNDILNQYSAVKMATTALANSYTTFFNVVTLRPFTAFGPLEDSTRFIKSTIEKALKNEQIKIVKGVVRDFIFVEDLAKAYENSVEIDVPTGSVINIGSGKKVSLEMVARLVKKITKSNSEIIFDETYKRPKDSACYADISLAKKLLKWQPELTLLQGLQKMIYFRQNDQ